MNNDNDSRKITTQHVQELLKYRSQPSKTQLENINKLIRSMGELATNFNSPETKQAIERDRSGLEKTVSKLSKLPRLSKAQLDQINRSNKSMSELLSSPAFKRATEFSNSSNLVTTMMSFSRLSETLLEQIKRGKTIDEFSSFINLSYSPTVKRLMELANKMRYLNAYNRATASMIRTCVQTLGSVDLSKSIQLNTIVNKLGVASSSPTIEQIDAMIRTLSRLNKNNYDQVIETAVYETIPDDQKNSQEDLDWVESIVQKCKDSKKFFMDWYQSLNAIQRYTISEVLDCAMSYWITQILNIGGYTLLVALLLPILFSKTSEHDPDNPDNTIVKD